MAVYKKESGAALYVAVGNVLIPFRTTWATYQKDFKDAEIKIIRDSEWSNFVEAEHVKIAKV